MEAGPVIVLGAARSGTKLMRSLVAKAGNLAEIPYDVNYLWRLGVEEASHDALSPTDLTPESTARIRQELRRAAGVDAGSCDFVEKSVSNILRVPYVRQVFPEARFVTVIRDGRDVAESAIRCWRERPNLGYAFAKAASFPWTRCFSYARRAAGNAIARALGNGTPPIWGPRYPGIEIDLAHHDLLEVCARQWLACMDAYKLARHRLAPGRYLEIHYEDLVEAPDEEMERLAEFLQTPRVGELVDYARKSVRTDRVRSRSSLSQEDQARLEGLLARTLSRWGYSLEFERAENGDASRRAA